MSIKARSRATEKTARPYVIAEHRQSGIVGSFALAFMALAAFWAKLFGVGDAEAAPDKTAPDNTNTLNPASRDPETLHGSSETDEPLPADTRVDSGYNADHIGALPTTDTGSAPRETAAVRAETAGPVLLPATQTAPDTGQSPVVATPVGPVSAPDTSAPDGNLTVPGDEDPLLPPDEAAALYDLDSLLKDLYANTANLSDTFVATLVDLAVNDWMSENALRRLQDGQADLTLGAYQPQSQSFAEILHSDSPQHHSAQRKLADEFPSLEAAFAYSGPLAGQMAEIPDNALAHPSTTSFL